MKKHITVLLIAAAASAVLPVRAQVTTTTGTNGVTTTTTNTATPPASFTAGLEQIGDAIASATNWAVVGGYGHSVTGVGRSVLFTEAAVNFNPYIGAVLGYDYLLGNGGHEFNSIRGGITLQAPLHPFAFIGSTFLTNVVCTPLVFDQVATSSTGTAANIVGGGVDFSVYSFWNLELHVGADYESRSGDAQWDGEYGLVHAALSRNF